MQYGAIIIKHIKQVAIKDFFSKIERQSEEGLLKIMACDAIIIISEQLAATPSGPTG